MNVGRRLVLGVVGLGTLVTYLLAGVVGYRLLRVVWAQRPPTAVVVATVLGTALVFGVLSYWTGTTRLRRSVDAVALPRSRAPELYRRYDRLTERMRAGEPSLLVARLPVPNAFAVGGPNGAIVVDRRLFALLSADEMETLLAHELAHFERRDALVQTLGYSLTQSLVGLVAVALFPVVVLTGGIARALALLRGKPESWSRSWLGRTHRGALGAVALTGFAVTLLVLSYSRRREWAADDRAAAVTGKPLALARALRKIERASTPDLGPLTPLYVHGTEENPLSRLLSTHPPMDARVERLQRRASQRG
ncbi:M48 family metallopeptidase [Haloarcula onubensis]|uniref:M48 family metalloprotease n=1 Tax=Haloarcula onubensis TaxID=2950539 RepID=A0ABU2FMV3_9EURY|nr:M48 family metalloprotease [Halomicroarcula sp. S3CR25-11]MDS0282091.1 M48 family metalloprotease [Halomicroarcula sp. S3CR25-11]